MKQPQARDKKHPQTGKSLSLQSTLDGLVQPPRRRFKLLQGLERVAPFHPLPWVTVLQWLVLTQPCTAPRGNAHLNSRELTPQTNHRPPGPHGAGGRESSANARNRGVGSEVRVESAPLPRRKPKVKTPAANPSAPAQSQRGRRHAAKVESVS